VEIERWGERGAERFTTPFDTIYLGGGTPSSLATEELARLLAALRRHLALAPEPRLFMEANPEDVSTQTVAAWRALSVDTLSLGAQSLDAAELRFLGRRHTPDQARRAVELALAAGFSTVSVDLIYGLPGQATASWRRQLDAVAALGPQHLSCYQLTYHDRTPFGFRHARGELAELPQEAQAELFLLTHRHLAELGYEGYEVSNFARAPRHRSQHNSKYWDHTPYLGLGPSAHSFAADRRWWNLRKVGPYQRQLAAGALPIEEEERLGQRQLALEHLLLALRTRAGLDLEGYHRRFGIDLARRRPAALDALLAAGLVRLEQERLRPTVSGLAVADALARALALE
jgi:oxygen-independent coproporphyrinogen III oxidase